MKGHPNRAPLVVVSRGREAQRRGRWQGAPGEQTFSSPREQAQEEFQWL